MKDSQLNVYNLKQMRQLRPESFDFVRFDPNNDCNVHCVYCHNHRSKDAVDTEELRAFLDENVLTIENFQMGCVMEPTLVAGSSRLRSRSQRRSRRRTSRRPTNSRA